MKPNHKAARPTLPLPAMLVTLVLLSAPHCLAHNKTVHAAISRQASLSSFGLQWFLEDSLGTTDLPSATAAILTSYGVSGIAGGSKPAINWIKAGSEDEDGSEGESLRFR